jgi:hypothetical protein
MENGMISNLPEPIAVTLLVIDVLEQLGVPYVVVGSLASTQHGTTRSTLDSDLVVQLDESQIPPLFAKLQGAFYADENMARNAIRNRSGFNLIHLETMFKVDLFIAKDGGFDLKQIDRRVARPVAEDLDRKIYILSAEDSILAKLRWYRLGGEQSERQWRDVVGVVKVQGGRLDLDYLWNTAAELSVKDLLARVLE